MNKLINELIYLYSNKHQLILCYPIQMDEFNDYIADFDAQAKILESLLSKETKDKN